MGCFLWRRYPLQVSINCKWLLLMKSLVPASNDQNQHCFKSPRPAADSAILDTFQVNQSAFAKPADSHETHISAVKSFLLVWCAGGSVICQALARHFPENCVGIHINMCFTPPLFTSPRQLLQVISFGWKLYPVTWCLSFCRMKLLTYVAVWGVGSSTSWTQRVFQQSVDPKLEKTKDTLQYILIPKVEKARVCLRC